MWMLKAIVFGCLMGSIRCASNSSQEFFRSKKPRASAPDRQGSRELGSPIRDGWILALTTLNMQRNKFSGPMPDAIRYMVAVTSLDFGYNNLIASMPDAMQYLLALTSLQLGLNKFSGLIPDAMQHMLALTRLNIFHNKLSGPVPDVMQYMVVLAFWYLDQNQLTGPMPDAIQSMSALTILNLDINKVSGPMPDALKYMAALTILSMESNQLSGPLPDATRSMVQTTKFDVCDNRLSGQIPTAMQFMLSLKVLELCRNFFSGLMPVVVGLNGTMTHLLLHDNLLRGSLPDALTQLRSIYILRVDENELSGSIPRGLLAWNLNNRAMVLSVSGNRLRGSLESTPPFQHFFANNNQLTGSLPPILQSAVTLLMSGNMFEGTLPRMSAIGLKVLGLAGLPGQAGGLRGPIPNGLCRARTVREDSLLTRIIMMSHQKLAGVIPPLPRLKILSLQCNCFQALDAVQFAGLAGLFAPPPKTTVVLVHNNLLSCHLPTNCGKISTYPMTLGAIGNQLHRRKPANKSEDAFPDWVTPTERNSLFWVSEREGRDLLQRVGSAVGILVAAAAARLGRHNLLQLMSGYQSRPGRLQLISAFAHLLSGLARGTLLRVSVLMLLLQWDRYNCPRALALASACLRSSNLPHILVVLMWGCFGFHGLAVQTLTGTGSQKQQAFVLTASKRWFLVWPFLFIVLLLLASPSILLQVAKSVPGFLGDRWGDMVATIICLGIGILQGLLGTFVVPLLAAKLTSRKHVSVTIANLFMNCFFPAVVIISLDTACLGHWVALWGPCKHGGQDFRRVLHMTVREIPWRGTIDIVSSVDSSSVVHGGSYTWGTTYHSTLLRPGDMCDPVFARGSPSIAVCTEATLLRLQDMWISKLVTSGLIIPAGRLGAGQFYKGSAEVVSKLAILLAYVMICSGHLLLVIPLLLLATSGEGLLVLESWTHRQLEPEDHHNIVPPSIILVQVFVGLVQLASASAHLPVLVMLLMVLLVHLVNARQ